MSPITTKERLDLCLDCPYNDLNYVEQSKKSPFFSFKDKLKIVYCEARATWEFNKVIECDYKKQKVIEEWFK